MAKHTHKWHFIKEVYIDEFQRVLYNLVFQRGTHAKFVCEECGETKLVKMSGKV